MPDRFSLQDVAVGARRIVGDRAVTDEVRRLAGDIADIAALLETWPVSRTVAMELDRELRGRVPGLCRATGSAFCGAPTCAALDAATVDPHCLRV